MNTSTVQAAAPAGIRVTVHYFAMLRGMFGRAQESLDLAGPVTVAELCERLCLRQPGLVGHLPSLAYGVNFEYSPLSRILADGDELALLPPVSGGSR